VERYRIGADAAVYFVTYSVVDWLPVFISEDACRLITDSLNYCHEQKGLRTNAYVIMPTHMHAIVFDAGYNHEQLQKSLTDFRKFTGRTLSDFCDKRMPRAFAETLRAVASNDRDRRFWQPSRHAEAIVTETFWRQKLDYLHKNPCRKGLVVRGADWRFSSAAYYVSDGQANCDIKISHIDWS